MIERVYRIPLRKECRKAPRYERAMKAVRTVRIFLQKHMKCEDVKLGRHLNMKILEHGRKNVPHHVEVKVVKDKEKVKNVEQDVVRAELIGFDIVRPVKEEKKKKSKIAEKVGKFTGKKEEEEKVKEEVLVKGEEKKEEVKFEKPKVEQPGVKLDKKEVFPKDEKPKHEKKK